MNSTGNTTTPTPLVPYSRHQMEKKYSELMISDAIDAIPGDIAYQNECVARLKLLLEEAEKEVSKVELKVFVDWETYFPRSKPTVSEREKMAKLVALESEATTLEEQARLKYKLAEVALKYLEDKYISLRKLYEAPPINR